MSTYNKKKEHLRIKKKFYIKKTNMLSRVHLIFILENNDVLLFKRKE